MRTFHFALLLTFMMVISVNSVTSNNYYGSVESSVNYENKIEIPLKSSVINKHVKINRRKLNKTRSILNAICPSECICQGLSVDCSNKALKRVPVNIPSNAIRLDLQGNQLNKLKVEDLSYLKNLKVLQIHDNQLETIERGSFDNLIGLERLRLNNNKLSYMPNDLFSKLKSLKRLDMSFNKIRSINKEIFSELKNLNNLQLDNNELTCIEKDAFNYLLKLDILSISDNNLTSLTNDFLLTNMHHLKSLRLHNNKIECNCNILWLSKLLLKNTHLAHEAKCFTRERAAYKEIISLKDDDFDCSSQENDDIEDSCSTEFNCPYPCVCENNIVDCKGKDLTEIPKFIPESTVELHLKKNLITEIPSGVFSSLKQLRLLDMSNNLVQKIKPDSFKGLNSLNTLILFRNEISNLPSQVFSQLTNLQFLQLSNNKLSFLVESLLTNLKNLNILLLNANKLTCLKRDTFNGLTNLNLLSLFDNQLKSLPSGLFDPFVSIQTIHLGRNPLVCDCKLKWLNDYFRTKPVERSGVTCSMPKRLAKKSIGSILNSKFRCNTSIISDYYLEEFCISVNECPKECTCQGTIIDCRGQGLVEIPSNIPSFATELYLQDNDIQAIKANGVFKQMKNLQKIDLRNNKIDTIDEEAFEGAYSLTDLFLNENRLKEIKNGMFKDLKNLKTLLLRANHLTSIQNNTFNGLDSLRLLSLYDNKIKCIQEDSFSNLKSLSTLNLMSNAFICDCNLKWIKNWLKQNNLAIGNPKCSLPDNLKDKSLANLNDNEFQCDTSSTDPRNECNIGVIKQKNLIVSSLTRGCPKNCTCSNDIVRCSHLKLREVPLDIMLDVKDLYIDSNEIMEIPSFINKFTKMEKLDLSSNRLSSVPSRIFENMKNLDTLILSFNKIECIQVDSFVSLTKLRLLSLYANHLTLIPENTFSDLTSLSHIALGLNPLYCDCNLAWLSMWIKSDYVEPGIARCNGPSPLSNKLILTTPTQYFLCQNETVPENKCTSCYKNKCQHNSNCVGKPSTTNSNQAYQCVCSAGYYGDFCEHKIDACFGQPCKNDGLCQPIMEDKYRCECKYGWEGNNCQTNINDCKSRPCLNNGTCIDRLAGYDCMCSNGFVGSNCENKVEWCSSLETNPCKNNGKCVKTLDKYRCDCPIGFEGDQCEINIDDCFNHKCQFGACVDGISNYSCKCKDGFSGQFCEIMNPIALALQNTPEKSTIVQYNKIEQQQLIGCTVNDCSNGGICFRASVNGQIDPNTRCKCPIGYTGEKCEQLKMISFKYEDSYVELESPDLESSFNLTFSVITEAEDGVLFYHGSKAKKHLGVELFKGRVRISYDIGNTLASTVFSYAKINDKQQHTIQLLIQGPNITIKILNTNEERTLGNQAGLFRFLNVGDEPLYVGGVPNSIKDRITKQLSHVKNASSFQGCLTSLYINSELRSLQQVEYSHKITPGCQFNEACYAANNKCVNNGKCVPIFSLNKEFFCECGSEYTGSFCENNVEKPLSYMALPLINEVSPKNKKSNGCTETIVNDHYVDPKSGCKTKRKFKMVKCKGNCSKYSSRNSITTRDSQSSSPNVELQSFRSLDEKMPFGYLIGTNKKQLNSRSLSMNGLTPIKRLVPECCVALKSKPRKFKLLCEDGSVLISDVSLIKECACSSKCEE